MKIAVFHNYLDNIGGAEVLTLTLAQALSADIYSCARDTDNISRMGFSLPVQLAGKIPAHPPHRQQDAARAFRRLNLNHQYDHFVITGDWAVSAAVTHHPNIWYAHGPKRELWDMYTYTREHIVSSRFHLPVTIIRLLFDVWVWYQRRLDRRYVANVDHIVCNSKTVQARIKKYLKRDATVVYPPCDTARFYNAKTGDYWLSVNRTSPPKRIELQIEAFRNLSQERLIIVGSYENTEHFLAYKRKLEANLPPNVEFRAHVPQAELVELYAHCKAFVTTARDEDFGMTAVEAMASGKAVIAPNEGGYRESVLPGETGILIDDISVAKIVAAIEKINQNPGSYCAASLARAKQFDTSRFIEAMRREIYAT